MTLTAVEENYLRTLHAISDGNGDISPIGVSRLLGVRKSTVTCMMQRLTEKGLVRYEPYKAIRLTDSGEEEGKRVLAKNRLSFDFLVRVMELDDEEASAIADELEHVGSKAFFRKAEKMLGRG